MFVVVLLGLYTAWHQRAWISQRAQVFILTRQCEEYVPTIDHKAIRPLQRGEKPLYLWYRGHPKYFSPACWENLKSDLGWGGVAYAPGSCDSNVLFLHERTSPAGHRRLVAIESQDGFMNAATFVDSSIPWKSPIQAWYSQSNTGPVLAIVSRLSDFGWAPPTDGLEVGEADPNDKAYFTLRFSIREIPGTIDGYLRDDDTVALRVRDSASLVEQLRRVSQDVKYPFNLRAIADELAKSPEHVWVVICDPPCLSTDDNQ
jgi:hypothetical protein